MIIGILQQRDVPFKNILIMEDVIRNGKNIDKEDYMQIFRFIFFQSEFLWTVENLQEFVMEEVALPSSHAAVVFRTNPACNFACSQTAKNSLPFGLRS